MKEYKYSKKNKALMKFIDKQATEIFYEEKKFDPMTVVRIMSRMEILKMEIDEFLTKKNNAKQE